MVHGWDGTSIGFLTNYNTRTTPLDYKLLIMPWRVGPRGVVLPPLFVPIFGWSDRNFRCIIYSRFNEPRKRSKEPRGLFLIIYRMREGRLSRSPSPFYRPFFVLLSILPSFSSFFLFPISSMSLLLSLSLSLSLSIKDTLLLAVSTVVFPFFFLSYLFRKLEERGDGSFWYTLYMTLVYKVVRNECCDI